MKIAWYHAGEWQDHVKQRLQEHEVLFFPEGMEADQHEQIKDVDAITSFVFSPVTRENIESLENLKIIATRSTGYDHIDLATCKERNVVVSNVPRYGENTVAEHTFSLILALAKHLDVSIRRVQSGSFDRGGLRGQDIDGKTLGIIGTGNIGHNVIRIANGFRMRVVAYDPYPQSELQETLGFQYVDFDTLLQSSDFISLHCPYNKHTHHILNEEAFRKMRDGTYIVNTARGKLIDSTALLLALQSGKIAGAGLDVLEEELTIKDETQVLSREYMQSPAAQTLLAEHVLINHPRVIVTPHNAFNTQEALQRIVDTTIDNLLAFASGSPTNLVQ